MLAFYMAMLDDPEDKLSFEELYNKYKDKMFSLAYGVTGNYHDAEEAVSQAFFSIAKNFRRIKEREPQQRRAYISVVTKNAALSVLRDRKRHGEQLFMDEDGEEPDIPDEKTNVSDEVLSSYGYERIVEAIRDLPEKYAHALYLFNVTGLSVKEISSSLGESEATVKKRLQRAREKLKLSLEEIGIAP